MEELAQIAIEAALKEGVSFADIRIEDTREARFEITDGITKQSVDSHSKGAGIRAFVKGAWAFAQTTDLTAKGMRVTAKSVARMALATKDRVAEKFDIDGPAFQHKVRLRVKRPLGDVTAEEKIGFAKQIDDQARAHDKRIANTRTIYGDTQTDLYIASSLGTSVWMVHLVPRIISIVTAKEGTNRQRAFLSVGGRGGYELMEEERSQILGRKAAERAVELLSSVAIKGGKYDVIMDPILNGVMCHEAFGHAAEADSWTAGTTCLEGKFGEAVGPDNLSIVDDPTMPGMRGSFEYDWEGTRARKRYLVKDGILNELLQNLETSSRLGHELNGAGRAQSFRFPPIPRMSNTFMEPRDWDVDELIADTKEGVLLCSFNYGYTNSAKGQFMFQASHGYLIEKGEKTQMVRDCSLAGLILEFLPKVDAIGKDFEMDSGTCGKDSQYVPDMSGGPHARARDVPIGGQ
ncbi:MAG: TldD/PmbA family protein [Promethearchaeota archaeon]